jgi:hypothetical protein
MLVKIISKRKLKKDLKEFLITTIIQSRVNHNLIKTIKMKNLLKIKKIRKKMINLV